MGTVVGAAVVEAVDTGAAAVGVVVGATVGVGAGTGAEVAGAAFRAAYCSSVSHVPVLWSNHFPRTLRKAMI